MVGGGVPHRMDLSSALMIKDNHRDLGVKHVPRLHSMCVEWECRSEAEVYEAVEQHPNLIMLDNMSATEAKRLACLIKSTISGVEVEVSGGINAINIVDFLCDEVDSVSMGVLTHSADIVDFSLKIAK